MGDLGKLIVAKGFKKLPKVKKIAQSGHTTLPPTGQETRIKPKVWTNLTRFVAKVEVDLRNLDFYKKAKSVLMVLVLRYSGVPKL